MDKNWLDKCAEWKRMWPVYSEQGNKLNDDSNGINLYKFYEILNQNLKEDSVVTWDAGSAAYCSNQCLRLNGGSQRSIGSMAQGEMFACLGISAGVSFAKDKGEVICCCGDGSLQGQIQALALIKRHNLPIKIFVFNNNGFLSIKNSQDKFYEGRRLGTGPDDDYFFPKTEDIAKTYKIEYIKTSLICNLDWNIKETLKWSGPIICEIICQEKQEILPTVTAIKTTNGKLEQCDFSNLAPFLK